MEESKNQDHHDEIADKKISKEIIEKKNIEPKSISKNEVNTIKDSNIKPLENNIQKRNTEILKEKSVGDNKFTITEQNTDTATSNLPEKVNKPNKEISTEKTTEDNKFTISEQNPDIANNKSPENIVKTDKEISTEEKLEKNKNVILTVKNKTNTVSNSSKEISTNVPVKAKTKPVKEPPIEKKPFLEFVNDYLIPEIKNEFKSRGKEVNKIILQKTHRPIAEDICWVIYCEINDTCNFWLSFEKDDITSLKSFSLCKNYEKLSIIESFLIDEKKITLKLIISRILQRLNGQKLIGAN